MASAAPDTLERTAWARASASTLAHHGACCDGARAWLLGMARSHDFTATDGFTYAAPGWLRRRWNWGPTRWPIAWCEATRAKSIDCGVFAAFAMEIFRAKGVEAYGGQVLRAAVEETIAHWRRRWSAVPGAFNWLGERVIYHEVCVVRVGPTEVRIYDPTEGVWLEPELRTGHGAHLAIRAEIPQAMTWGPHVLVGGQWTEIAPDA
jgi:hypothetical protein